MAKVKDPNKNKCRYCGDTITLEGDVWMHRADRWSNDDRIRCYHLYNGSRKAEPTPLKNQRDGK